MNPLERLGWSREWAERFRALAIEGAVPGRVVRVDNFLCRVRTEAGETSAKSPRVTEGEARPVVGDWVAILPGQGDEYGRVAAVLERRTLLSRGAAGRVTARQGVAANVDTTFVVAALDGDFNPRRIERMLTVAWGAGSRPVVVLNKADLCADVSDRVRAIEAVAPGVPVVPLSAKTGEGIDGLAPWLRPATTIVLLGSSGVGKSTIVNALADGAEGIDLKTAAVREHDDRGRHTTTWRELVELPSGVLLIDTPGVREIQPWVDAGALDDAFADITEFADGCRFRDCRHDREPACAVREAVASGELDRDRWDSFTRLRRELESFEERKDEAARRADERRFGKLYKRVQDGKRRERSD